MSSDTKEVNKRPIRTLVGIVTSDKMNKSRKVVVERRIIHPDFEKEVRRRTGILVHDEKNESHVGDLVEVTYCRPLSRQKHFRLVKILKKACTEPAAKEPEGTEKK